MNNERSKAIVRGQQLRSFYAALSREKLIDELTATEKIVANIDTSNELRFLYLRRYMKILEILKEKLENFEYEDLNERMLSENFSKAV